MDIFLQDKQLNISEYYLRPGFAFGGSCLPKDLRALTYFGRQNDLELPLLNSTLASNKVCIESLVNRILATGAKKIGLYGLSFKRNTDDLRESPYVIVAEQLLGKGIELKIYDENIQVNRLTGANKEYIDTHIPHLINFTVDSFNAFDGFAELVVFGHRSEEASYWATKRDTAIKIIDLARLANADELDNYEGISW
jgi:GDP-mannose 6-dehydrogenase